MQVRLVRSFFTSLICITLTACGGGGSSESKSVTQNTTPLANDDSVVTSQNLAISIDVLANDAGTLSANIVSTSPPINGSIIINNNSLLYSPAPGFVGQDTFTYTIKSGTSSESTANVVIEVNNVVPIAENDAEKLFKNNLQVIDVLGNDLDVIGDTLTIDSVSTPLHGTAIISEGKISYQPAVDYVGEDSFNYTVIDNYNASSTGMVSLNIINGLILEGKLIGFEKPDISVTASVNNNKFSAITNAQGKFSIRIDDSDPKALVVFHAENVNDNFSLHGYMGDIEYLLSDTENDIVTNKNLSSLSTAEYELVNYVHAVEYPEESISTNEQLTSARYLIDTDIVLGLAIGADIINADNNIELPIEFEDINAFMQSPFKVQSQLEQWRVESSDDYYDIYAQLFDNEELTAIPNFNQVDNMLLYSSKTSRIYGQQNIILNPDNTGHVRYRFSEESNLGRFNWQYTGGGLQLDFLQESQIHHGKVGYCLDGLPAVRDFYSTHTKIKKLYTTPQYNVYIRKSRGEFKFSECLPSEKHSFEYDTRLVSERKPVNISYGRYFFSSFRKPQENDNSASLRISATFDLAQNGTFLETVNDFISPRTGSWSIDDSKLVLEYDDGVTVSYEKIAHYKQLDLMSVVARVSGKIFDSSVSYFVPDTGFVWSNYLGTLNSHTFPVYNKDRDGIYGFKFFDNNTGTDQSISPYSESWRSNGDVFSWSIENNIYTMDYYYTPEQDEFLPYCDTSEENCERWKSREIEIVGQIDSKFIVKVYYEVVYPEHWGFSPVKSGYLSLVNFSEL